MAVCNHHTDMCYVCVCMSVYTCVYTCVCIHVCVHVYTCVYEEGQISKHIGYIVANRAYLALRGGLWKK